MRSAARHVIGRRVFDALPWPDQNYGEDHAQFKAVKQHPEFGNLTVESEELLYVHRRHDSNASIGSRQNLWQGVMPLQLAGETAVSGAALVTKLLAEPHPSYLMDAVAEERRGQDARAVSSESDES